MVEGGFVKARRQRPVTQLRRDYSEENGVRRKTELATNSSARFKKSWWDPTSLSMGKGLAKRKKSGR
jgi:hypothetical protein